MYRNSLSALIITATVATTSAAIFADDDPLEPLSRRVGTWTVKNYQKKAECTPKARKDTGVETIKWVLDKKFIQGDVLYADGRKAHWLMNYDLQAKVYRSWFFDSRYVFPRGNTVGRYDAKAKRMDWKMDLGNGVNGKMTFKDIDKDTAEWSLIAHDANGKLMFDGGGVLTRKDDRRVDLPVDRRAQALANKTGDIVKINVLKSGSYVIMGKPVNEEKFEQMLKAHVSKNNQIRVLIRAAKDAKHFYVANALSICKFVGVKETHIVVKTVD